MHGVLYYEVMERKVLQTGKLAEFKEGFSRIGDPAKSCEICGETIYICREEEWDNALLEKREPECVGFNHGSLIRIIHPDESGQD